MPLPLLGLAFFPRGPAKLFAQRPSKAAIAKDQAERAHRAALKRADKIARKREKEEAKASAKIK